MKNAKKRIEAVPAETNDERNKRLNDEWNAIQKEREQFDLSLGEIETIFDELLQTLDRFFIETAFNFRTNLDGSEGHWSKHSYLEGFVDKLSPYARHCEKKLAEILPRRYPDNVPGEPDSDLCTAVWEAEKCAFVVGVFMGARLAGASREMLNDLRRYVMV